MSYKHGPPSWTKASNIPVSDFKPLERSASTDVFMYQRNVIPKSKVLAALENAVALEFANICLSLSLWFGWSYVTGVNTKLHSHVPAATYRHDPS